MIEAMSHWRVVVELPEALPGKRQSSLPYRQRIVPPALDREGVEAEFWLATQMKRRVLGIWRVTPKIRGEGMGR